MKNQRLSLLFVIHSCDVNGATTSVLNVVQQLSQQTNGPVITVLIMQDGPLANSFERLNIESRRLARSNGGIFSRLLAKFTNSLIVTTLKFKQYDAIVGNTCISIPTVRKVSTSVNNVYLWIHELEFGLIANLGIDWANNFLPHDNILSCGPAVTEFLRRTLGNQIQELGECVNFESLTIPDTSERTPPINVAMVGTLNWRKGADFFLQVAHAVKLSHLSDYVRFSWIGSPQSELDLFTFRQNVAKMELESHVEFAGPETDQSDIFHNVDVLFLSSYEDPNPLVVLEATWLGIPTITMEHSGGAPYVSMLAGCKVCKFRHIPEVLEQIALNVVGTKATSANHETRKQLFELHSPEVVANHLMRIIEQSC